MDDTKKIEEDIKALEQTLNALKSKLDAVTSEKAVAASVAPSNPNIPASSSNNVQNITTDLVSAAATFIDKPKPIVLAAPNNSLITHKPLIQKAQTVRQPVVGKRVDSDKLTDLITKEPLDQEEGESVTQNQDSAGNENTEPKGPPIGEVGTFDGEFVWMPNEKKYQVPPNYISKTMLVAGDKLKMLSHGDQNEFKIMEQVERVELQGILTKKNYLWTVMVGAQEFKVISAAIRYHGGDIGDKVNILVPLNYIKDRIEWAAVVSVEKNNLSQGGYAGSKSAEEIQREKRMKFVPRREIPEPNKVDNKVNQDSNTLNIPKPITPSRAPIAKPTVPVSSNKSSGATVSKPLTSQRASMPPSQSDNNTGGNGIKSGEIPIRSSGGEVVLGSEPKPDNASQAAPSAETVITAMDLSDIIPLR